MTCSSPLVRSVQLLSSLERCTGDVDVTATDMALLQRLHDRVCAGIARRARQSTIDHFFRPAEEDD